MVGARELRAIVVEGRTVDALEASRNYNPPKAYNPNFESIIVRRQKQFLRDKNGENRAACQSFLRFDSANEKKLRTLKIGSFWIKSWLIFETYV